MALKLGSTQLRLVNMVMGLLSMCKGTGLDRLGPFFQDQKKSRPGSDANSVIRKWTGPAIKNRTLGSIQDQTLDPRSSGLILGLSLKMVYIGPQKAQNIIINNKSIF